MPPELWQQVSILVLFGGSIVVLSYLAQTLAFLARRSNGFWLKVLLWGLFAYFLLLAVLTGFRLIGIRDTQYGEITFLLYILTTLFLGVATGLFCQYMVGGLPSPGHDPTKPPLLDLGDTKPAHK